MPKRLRLVLVEWEDSGQPAPQWQWLSDVRISSAVRCHTVGFLIQDDRTVKVVAQNLGDLESDARQVPGVIRIPARAVTQITALRASKAAYGRAAVLART